MKVYEEVIVIGGTAVQTSAYPTISAVAEMFMQKGADTYFIDGATYTDTGELTVITPREQAAQARELIPDIDNPNRKRLFLTHCLGMAAAVQIMDSTLGESQLVALAPPLPSPFATTSTPHSRKNITNIDGKNYVPGFSWSDEPFKPTMTAKRVDVALPSYRDQELAEDEPDFLQAVELLESSNRLGLVIATKDWNTASPTIGRDFSRVLELDLTHSLMDRMAPSKPVHEIFDFIIKQVP